MMIKNQSFRTIKKYQLSQFCFYHSKVYTYFIWTFKFYKSFKARSKLYTITMVSNIYLGGTGKTPH